MNTQFQNKSQVRLKGVKDGFWVTLDPKLPMAYLEEELTRLFNQLQHLALNSRVILDIGQSDGYEDIFDNLAVFLKNKFNVASVSVPKKENDHMEGQSFKLNMSSSAPQNLANTLVISGRIRSGQQITARRHLIILGDVNPGSEVIAGGDIIVMGSLSGTALAGQPDNENAIIMAINFKPTQIQIAGMIAVDPGKPSSSPLSIEYAHIEHGGISVENYIKSNPFGRLTWPLVR